jgi:hypothetical protein
MELILATEITDILNTSGAHDEWSDSVFRELHNEPPAVKGRKLKLLAMEILKRNGLTIEDSGVRSAYSFKANGRRIALKTSTKVKNTINNFSFLQIKDEQEWDDLLMMVLFPNGRIQFYQVTKKEVMTSPIFHNQHTGRDFTRMFSGSISAFPSHWYKPKYETLIYP